LTIVPGRREVAPDFAARAQIGRVAGGHGDILSIERSMAERYRR